MRLALFLWFACNLSTPQVFKVAQTSEEHIIRLTVEVISWLFSSFYLVFFPIKRAFCVKLFPGCARLLRHVLHLSSVLFLAGFKGHIGVNDCGNGACDTLLYNSPVCVNRNLAEDSQDDELHWYPTVIDL